MARRITNATDALALGEGRDRLALPGINKRRFVLKIRRLEGGGGLIPHQFGAKAREAMAAKQQNRPAAPLGPKSPENDAAQCLYMISGKPNEDGARYGMPAGAFRHALVDATAYTGRKISKKRALGTLFVVSHDGLIDGGLVEVKPLAPLKIRCDPMTNANGVADLRYRYEIPDWEAEIVVEHDADVISRDQIAALAVRAGYSIGCGDSRPSQESGPGSFGRFEPVEVRSIA